MSDAELPSRIISKFKSVHAQMLSQSVTSTQLRALPNAAATEGAFSLQKPTCAEFLPRKENQLAPKITMYLYMSRES